MEIQSWWFTVVPLNKNELMAIAQSHCVSQCQTRRNLPKYLY